MKSGLLLAVLFGVLGPTNLYARTWTDSTGKHKVEAEFVEIQDGKVTLKRANGKTVVLPIAKLSDADQAYLQANHAQQAWKVGDKLYIQVRGQWQLAVLTEIIDSPGAARYRVSLKSGDRRTIRATEKRMRRYGKAGDHDALLPGDIVEYKSGFEWVTAELVSQDGNWAKIKLEGALATTSTPVSRLRVPGTANVTTGRTRVASSSAPAKKRPPTPTGPSIAYPEPPELTAVTFAGIPIAAASSAQATSFQPPEVELADAPATLRRLPLSLSGKRNTWDKPLSLSVAAQGSRAAVLRDSWGNKEQLLELIDLRSQSKVLLAGMPAKTNAVYVSPDGSKVLSRRSDPYALDLWEILPDGVTHLVSWNPKQSPDDYWEQLTQVRWVDDHSVLTATKAGVVVWKATQAQPIYKTESGGTTLMLPGGKHFAQLLSKSRGIALFETATGDMQALIGAGKHLNGSLTISPSGRLAIICDRQGLVELWDLTTGKRVIRTLSPPGTMKVAANWTHSDGVVKFAGRLCSLPSFRPLEKPTAVPSSPANQTVSQRNQQRLRTINAPPKRGSLSTESAGHLWSIENLTLHADPVSRSVVNEPIDLTVTGPYLLTSGGPIAVSVAGPTNIRAAMQTRIEEAVAQQGFQVSQSSRISLRATTSEGKSETQTYRRIMGDGDPETTVSYRPRSYTLTLLVDGQPRWEVTHSLGAPGHVSSRDGKSFQQLVREHLAWNALNVPLPNLPPVIFEANAAQ